MGCHRGLDNPGCFNDLVMPSNNNKNKVPKRRGRGRKVAPLPCVVAPPSSMRSLLTYSKGFLLAESASGIGGSYAFRLNSPYDPDSSGVGSVATGFNQWLNFYRNYRVTKVTVRLRGQVAGGTSATSAAEVIMIPVALQAVIPSDAYLWKTLPHAKSQFITVASNGGKNVVDMQQTFDVADVLKVSKKQYAQDFDFTGSSTTNPERQAFVMVGVLGVGVTTAVTLAYTISLTYQVEWFNPIPLQ